MARSSSISKLPEDILEQLQELLRDPRINQLEATKKINKILKAEGEGPISKSAVNRYSVKMEKVGEKLRQSREISKMWIAKLGAQPQGQMGQLINEMLRTLAFDLSLLMQSQEVDSEDLPGVIKMVKELSIAMHRLEQAASENTKREKEIRKQMAEEAAETAGEVARSSGMSKKGVQEIKNKILGIA
jgi:DNA-binding transcriptional regulator WhiA